MRQPPALAIALLLMCAVTGCGNAERAASGPEPRPTGVVGRKVAEVRIPGVPRPLVLTRQAHPRGGFQLRLYVDPGAPIEVLDGDHNPVIPFVATDTTPGSPVSADCGSGGFTVTEAQPTNPAGVTFSWDVSRTTYRVSGDRAVVKARETIDTAIPDKRLRSEMPELFAHRMFADCPSR